MSEEEYIIAENKLIEDYKSMSYNEALDATVWLQLKYKNLGTKLTKEIINALDETFKEERNNNNK